MKRNSFLNGIILLTLLSSCNSGKTSTSIDNGPKPYLIENGIVDIIDLQSMAYVYNELGDVIFTGVDAPLNNASLRVYKLDKTNDYFIKVFVNDKYDLDQIKINEKIVKYTDFEGFFTKSEGKSYEYKLDNFPQNNELKIFPRIYKEKTASLINKDEELKSKFEGKQYSILGDSISTFRDVNNNVSYNSTLSGNAVYYPCGSNTGKNLVISQDETYWGQMLYDLNLNLCVNNSSSGSYVHSVTTNHTQTACISRCINLHNDKENIDPDFITVYLGINDFGDYCNNRTGKEIGTFEKISDLYDGFGEYKESNSSTFVTGYAMMVDKMVKRYPTAKIYISSLLPSYWNRTQDDLKILDIYNKNIKNIAKIYDIGFVDMAVDFKEDLSTLENYYEDTMLHPNTKGMARMATVFENAIIKDLTYQK